MYALDTNTVIYFFKGMGRVSEKLLAVPPGEVAIPAIVLYELEVGVARSPYAGRRREQLAELAGVAGVLPFDAAEARAAAGIRADLEARGEPIGPTDVLIAATALTRQATLVTHNTREFGRVAGLELDDWY